MTAAPGPYAVDVGIYSGYTEIVDVDGEVVASVERFNVDVVPTARLLAASWKMREALRTALRFWDIRMDQAPGSSYSECEAALAEADGGGV